jgi:hypothetical protein
MDSASRANSRVNSTVSRASRAASNLASSTVSRASRAAFSTGNSKSGKAADAAKNSTDNPSAVVDRPVSGLSKPLARKSVSASIETDAEYSGQGSWLTSVCRISPRWPCVEAASLGQEAGQRSHFRDEPGAVILVRDIERDRSGPGWRRRLLNCIRPSDSRTVIPA